MQKEDEKQIKLSNQKSIVSALHPSAFQISSILSEFRDITMKRSHWYQSTPGSTERQAGSHLPEHDLGKQHNKDL